MDYINSNNELTRTNSTLTETPSTARNVNEIVTPSPNLRGNNIDSLPELVPDKSPALGPDDDQVHGTEMGDITLNGDS